MNNKAGCGSVGIAGTLTIVFIVLKLCGLITWSWWWVTAPLWGGIALILAILVVFMLIMGITALARRFF